jgi:hypothetical protein
VRVGLEQIGFTEGTDATDDAVRISQLTDAKNLRNHYSADIVVTLTGDVYTSFGSVANDIPANNSTAYAVVETPQATLAGAYTFSHEVGHLFGGLHDISTLSPSYARGYVLPGQSTRDIMAVRVNNGEPTRILYFSNPNVTFNGTPIGTANNNAARRIDEVSSTIANFRSSVSNPFYAFIDGPSTVNNTNSVPFEVAYQCNVPIAYEWSLSRDGFNFGSPIGWTEYISPYITSSDNGLYYLRCRITLPSGQVNTVTKYVSVNICEGCRIGQPAANEKIALTLTTSPNPASGNTINLNFTLPEEASVSVVLTNAGAVAVKKLELGKLTQGNHRKQIEVTGLNAGLYLVRLQAGSQVRSQKVVLVK